MREKNSSSLSTEFEADSASFVSMVLKKSLHDISGGFDEGMDGGEWALRDFVRRATLSGYTTYSMEMDSLKLSAIAEFGSLARRQEREQSARQLYIERWGEPLTYLLVCTDSLFGVNNAEFREVLLASARQGHRISIVAESRIGRLLSREGFATLHENISFKILPKLFSSRALQGILSRFAGNQPSAILVSEDDSFTIPFSRMSFTDFASGTFRRR